MDEIDHEPVLLNTHTATWRKGCSYVVDTAAEKQINAIDASGTFFVIPSPLTVPSLVQMYFAVASNLQRKFNINV